MSHSNRNTKSIATASIYARYSSDMQNPESANDQIARIRYNANKGNIRLTKYPSDIYQIKILNEWVLKDEDETGKVASREGYQQIFEGIKENRFHVLLVDDLSRLTRSLGDQITLYELLKFNGIELFSLCDGVSSEAPNAKVNFFMKGFVNDIGNEGHAMRTKRGMEARVLKGFSSGDICYGYRSRPTMTRISSGREMPSHYEIYIDPQEAAVINMIFDMKLAGRGFASIAAILNERKIPSPARGHKRAGSQYNWSATTIKTILEREKYIGIWKWGKTSTVQNPMTKKTTQKPKPEREWVEHLEGKNVRDDLVIVPLAKWQAVQKIMQANTARYRPKGSQFDINNVKRSPGQSSKTLFSGILHCHECGSPLCLVSGRRDGYYGCWTHHRKDKTQCSNNKLLSRKKLETEGLRRLELILTDSIRLGEAAKELNSIVKQKLDTGQDQLSKYRKQAAEIQKEIDNLVKFVVTHGDVSESLRNSLTEKEKAMQHLTREIKLLEKSRSKTIEIDATQLLNRYSKLYEILLKDPILGNCAIRSFFPNGLQAIPKQIDETSKTRWEIKGDMALGQLKTCELREELDSLSGSQIDKWRPQGDSNPCYRRERAMS